MDKKLSKYSIKKIDSKEFGNLNLEEFLSELKRNNIEMAAIIPFEKGAEFAAYILDELWIDPEYCILYPENLEGTVYYDKANDEMAFGDYKYLVVFKEKEYGNEYVYWYSAYKNLENISKELKLLD